LLLLKAIVVQTNQEKRFLRRAARAVGVCVCVGGGGRGAGIKKKTRTGTTYRPGGRGLALGWADARVGAGGLGTHRPAWVSWGAAWPAVRAAEALGTTMFTTGHASPMSEHAPAAQPRAKPLPPGRYVVPVRVSPARPPPHTHPQPLPRPLLPARPFTNPRLLLPFSKYYQDCCHQLGRALSG
jgi:hypothetical protein